MLDLHVHLLGHKDREANRETIRAFLDEATRRGLKEIGFADHDYYWDQMNFPLIREVAKDYPNLAVRIGFEAEYRPHEEDRIKNLLHQFPFDFVLGSVHEFDGWIFDIPEEEHMHHKKDADEFYARYFEVVTLAAKSGLFTTIGHLDLIKVFGVRPRRDILTLADEALTAVEERGLVLEVNTNGRYKPVREFYPEQRLMEEIQRRGIEFTLGSDAHSAENVGRDLEEASQMLREIGVQSVVGFSRLDKVSYTLD
ncbi:histidinol-phosphatase HisJ family protein [Desulfosporosinus sp.]|uniref:histidinol-phosphatase HisJ family protein n=1 Tax=Desulfosporosinus sp. TaxID=157907 RepID=UPI0025BAB271|nr:histidinol-phosphatase HisJ family protein [Desulfosporosinus sp.]MBC2721408.1 histidinol-phosphatase HisJ family protein [Desulfosporosinus sp.]MBC2728073.1 histidinol-phosphatase HisJ family protein [Desulfosporosinus sp.]